MTQFKYNEDELITELRDYVSGTYDQHYSQNKFQATEFVIDAGHGEGFVMGNIVKYAARYGKKAGKNRDDLLKVLHYALIALHVHDKSLDVPQEVAVKPKATPVEVTTLPRIAKVSAVTHVTITQCPDGRKWYADKVGKSWPVGELVDSDTGNPAYRTKQGDAGSYTNFIMQADCEPIYHSTE